MATLELRGLRKSFGATEILRGIDLALGDGEARTTPQRAVAYARAGVPAQEVWASERLPDL